MTKNTVAENTIIKSKAIESENALAAIETTTALAKDSRCQQYCEVSIGCSEC